MANLRKAPVRETPQPPAKPELERPAASNDAPNPMCMQCFTFIPGYKLFQLCFRCSQWICSTCQTVHEVFCSVKNTPCQSTCMECGEHRCGQIAGEDACDLQNRPYHVCALCVIKAIDLRHPTTWANAFRKSVVRDQFSRCLLYTSDAADE